MVKPGFNPNDTHHLQRLYKAVEWSKSKFQTFREHNVRSIAQLAGRFYGENTDIKVPVNMFELAYTIYLRHLAGGNPRIESSTQYRNLRPFAVDFELVMNDVLDRMRFVDPMRAVVGNALLSMGIVKVGVEAGENVESDSEKPFVDAIGLDNWVHDMAADCRANMQYMGNEFSLPLETAMDTKDFNKKQSGKLTADEGSNYNKGGDNKAHSISVSSMSSDEGRIHDVAALQDIWLPYDRLLITIDAQHILDKPLRVVEFDDEPENGPYEILSFCELQGNTVPLPPSALWMDLHRLANNIFNKLENQAQNARMVTTFTGPQGQEDAQRMDATNDGGACGISGGAKPETTKTNSIDPTNLAFLIQVKDLFAYFGGNLDALGGLGPQSPTLGQDQMLLSGASQRLAEMQDRTHEFQSRVVRTLSYYEHSGTAKRMLKKTVPGTNIEVDVVWDKARRKVMGPLENYQIRIAPYSSSGVTPAAKLSALTNIWTTFVVPMLPYMQQMGYGIDPHTIFEVLARWANLPELEGVITEGAVPIDQTPGANSAPTSPKTGQTTHVRENRPQSTRHTRDAVIMQSLLGNQSQPAEAGKLTGALG